MIRNLLNNYKTNNHQEIIDKKLMLEVINEKNVLNRNNEKGHFSASAWIVNNDNSKVLMIYHNIYQSYAWIGGHLDDEEDIYKLIKQEIREETGLNIQDYELIKLISLESLPVCTHQKNDVLVKEHLHYNLTFLIIAKEEAKLTLNLEETSDIKWIDINDVLTICDEEIMIPIYEKLINRTNEYLKK